MPENCGIWLPISCQCHVSIACYFNNSRGAKELPLRAFSSSVFHLSLRDFRERRESGSDLHLLQKLICIYLPQTFRIMDIGIGKPITLLDFVKRVFNSWPGYQLAIQHQLAGSNTAEVHAWLCQITSEYAEQSPSLTRDTLAEWLEEIFDNEFGLILDDNSADVFANVIINGAKHLRQGAVEEMRKQWDSLKETGGQISKAEGQESSSDSEGEDDAGDGNGDHEDEPMEEDKPSKQKGPKFVEGDDGWTQVCRR